MSRTTINCEGITRRDFLQIGLGGTMGLGLCDLLDEGIFQSQI